MHPAVVRWTLLVTMALTIPLVYLMIIVGGLLTYAHIIVFSFMAPGLLAFNAIYLIGYGTVLYFVAGFLANRIVRLKQHVMLLVWGGIVLLLLAMGLAPIYGAGHGTPNFMNAYKLLASGTLR